MKKIPSVIDFLNSKEFTKKITIYLATKVAGEDFDTYENNYTNSLMNPVTIRGYVSTLSPEALVYKQYGLANIGAVEVITTSNHKNYFALASKVLIDGVEYQCFREGTGNKTIIQDRPAGLIRVVLTRKV